VYRLDANGIIQSRIPWKEERRGADYSHKLGVKAVLETHKPFVSELFESATGRYKCISICHPVFEDKLFIGILRAVVRLSTISNMIRQIEVGRMGYAWVVDDNGIIVSHPNSTLVGQTLVDLAGLQNQGNESQKTEIAYRMLQGTSGAQTLVWDELSSEKIVMAWATANMENRKWALGVCIGYGEISGPVTSHSRNALILSVLTITIFAGLLGATYRLYKKEVLLEIQAQSGARLEALNAELESEIEQRKRGELQLRSQKERLKNEVWTRREAEGQLEEQVAELAQAREAALNMMEDAESAKEQAEQAGAKLERANLQLEAAAEHANVLAQEALVANRTKSEFLANMSHEIRTPMNSVIGFSDVLAEEKLTEQQYEHVNLIRESGRHLMEIINDILDFSKVEAGKLDAELVECSLGSLLNSVEALMGPKATEKGLKFQIAEGKRLPSHIRTDPVRLRQCLINLVDNAIKFAEQGHVHVNVSMHDRDGKDWIRFDVEDTGIGIAAEKQDAIFEAFMQADGGTTRRFGGTGLGLAITRKLTELLGGELTLSSEAGKGSIFTLAIPAGVDVTKQPIMDRHEAAAQTTAKPDKPQPVKFSGRALVAEDSRTNQVLAKLLLEKMGFDVTIAQDGNEAVQKALSQRFDLILMDMQMPNMNGLEATKALRSKSVTTPIVALTAYAMKGDEKKCLAAGCDDYLAKPINHEQLLKTIAKYVPVKNGDLSKRIDSIKSEVEQLGRLCDKTESPDVKESEHSGTDTGKPSQS
jgi:signal transduction histidine kinase/FixJ family two-component response regulator